MMNSIKKINTCSHQLVQLCSDELTRRSTDRWSQKLTSLTFYYFLLHFCNYLFHCGVLRCHGFQHWFY